jgi:hypothetical protein
MTRSGIANLLMNNSSAHDLRKVDNNQLSMFDIFEDDCEKFDDDHETTYELLSPNGELITLTFTTNDPSAFNEWCTDNQLNYEKIHEIAKEGLDTSYNGWSVKKIDNPVEEVAVEPEPVKKPRRKRKTKVEIIEETEPKRKPRAKKPIKVLEIGDKVEDKLPEPIFDEDHAQDQVIAQIFAEAEEEESTVKDDITWVNVTQPTNRKQRRAAKKRKRK